MKKINFAGLIPLTLILGTWIGNRFAVPMVTKVVDALYYKDKYNNDAADFCQKYINDSIRINVTMPEFESKFYLRNVDKKRFPLFERFKDTSDSREYFNYPKADYWIFYCVEYKKCMNIISFRNVPGRYGGKKVTLIVNREDMNNPQYGTEDNPVPVLNVIGVSEPIWFNGSDTDSVFMDKFYRNNVIQYLKYKMPKEEFERRFKGKTD